MVYCDRCGWWAFDCEMENLSGKLHIFSACAVLQKFSIDSQDVPIRALMAELSRSPEALAEINPIKMEELVASIWSSCLGYRVESCSYGRPDRGIDIVIIGHDTGRSAIQVKRYCRPIELGEIHRFAGAMLASDFKRGTFVTSGRFRSGCTHEASEIERRAELVIDLVDGKRLLEFLEINNHDRSRSQPPCPYWNSYGYHGPRRPMAQRLANEGMA
jgi:restriction endonuclease Mrr